VPRVRTQGQVDGIRVLNSNNVERVRAGRPTAPIPCSSACRPDSGPAFTPPVTGGGPVQCAGFMSGRYKQVKLPVFYRITFLADRLRRR